MADVKISALPAASALTGTELVPIVQGGVTVQSTPAAFVSNGTLAGSFTQVGIGTASPAQRLSLSASAANVGMRMSSVGGTGRDFDLISNTAGNLVVKSDLQSNILTYDGILGNLGLGVTPSAWGSGIKSQQIGNYTALTNNQGGYTWLSNNAFYDTSWKYLTTNRALLYAQDTADAGHKWYNAAPGTAGNAISFTQAMTLDASGNLGIGTTSPGGSSTARQLTLFGTTAQVSASVSAFTANFGNNGTVGYLEATGANSFAFYTNSTERMRLDASGNLGLGVTPSAWWSSWKALQVGGSAALWSSSSGVSGTYLSNNNYFNGTNRVYIANGTAAEYAQLTTGAHVWYNAPSGTAGNAISFTQAMTLGANGNLGIGTSSPAYKLDVTGVGGAVVARFSGNTTSTQHADVLVQRSGTASTSIGAGSCIQLRNNTSNKGWLVQAADDVLQYWVNPGNDAWAERMRLDSSGNLITTVNAAAPSLSTNSTMSFELTSNTSLKVVVRGTDGVTRSVSLTLS